MVQCIGLCSHGLDGDAHAVRRSVNLNGVVLLDAGFLPNIKRIVVAFERYVCVVDKVRTVGLQFGDVFFEAEAIVDEFVVDLAAVFETGVFLEFSSRNVGLVQQRERTTGQFHGQVVNLFAQSKVGVPAFGIRHVGAADVLDRRRNRNAFAREGDGVGGAIGERETGKCARPVTSENGGAAVVFAFKGFEFPFLVLQESVQGVRSPAYVVHKFVGLALPGEFGVGRAAGEGDDALQPRQSSFTGTEYGTAVHRLLELFDYKHFPDPGAVTQEELDGWREELAAAGRIPQSYYKELGASGILAFLRSALAARMAAADARSELFREQPFVLGIGADKVNPQFPAEEIMLVQGIIDAYFEEDGELVLIDYKTDKVASAQELIDRYKVQLDLYERALTQIIGKRVKEKLIYSVSLRKTISL